MIPIKPDSSPSEKKNKDFYDELYRERGVLKHLVHMTVSFDQQSKAKRNKRLIGPYLSKAIAESKGADVSLLDFGSGWGSFLKKMPRKIKLYCYDLSEQAMARVCKTLSLLGHRIEAASLKNFEITGVGKLDFIVCSHVLEHVDDDKVILNCFYQTLSSNGLLLLNVPINEVWDDPKHVREYTPAGMKQLLSEIGFEVVAESEEDKWTAFLLEKEFLTGEISAFKKYRIRLLRLILSLTPLAVVNWSERVFLSKRPHQQYLVLAVKRGQASSSKQSG